VITVELSRPAELFDDTELFDTALETLALEFERAKLNRALPASTNPFWLA
jgi:hypothetical protein